MNLDTPARVHRSHAIGLDDYQAISRWLAEEYGSTPQEISRNGVFLVVEDLLRLIDLGPEFNDSLKCLGSDEVTKLISAKERLEQALRGVDLHTDDEQDDTGTLLQEIACRLRGALEATLESLADLGFVTEADVGTAIVWKLRPLEPDHARADRVMVSGRVWRDCRGTHGRRERGRE